MYFYVKNYSSTLTHSVPPPRYRYSRLLRGLPYLLTRLLVGDLLSLSSLLCRERLPNRYLSLGEASHTSYVNPPMLSSFLMQVERPNIFSQPESHQRDFCNYLTI